MMQYFKLGWKIFFLWFFVQNVRADGSPDIDSLISQMTIEEKIGQMTQICFSQITLNGNKELFINEELLRSAILKYHVGSFLSGTGSRKEWTGFINKVQHIAIDETRLSIPVIVGIDHIHGANYVNEGIFLPHNISLACSFNNKMVRKAAEITVYQSLDLGLNWNFAPVLDLARNPMWPRFYETYGEDPYLTSQMGKAFIQTHQGIEWNGKRMATCAKHFIGYSDPLSGWDRTPAEIPEQSLYEYFIPPFQSAVDAGVLSVMANSGELNGEAIHASEYYLQNLLREKLDFNNVLVTDIKDVRKLVEEHKVVPDMEEALLLSLNAGFDVFMMCDEFTFLEMTTMLLKKGRITEQRIDHSVRKILKLKKEVGLFDNPFSEYSNSGIHKDYYNDARKITEESLVLLKNDNILPLDKKRQILIAGFGAHSKYVLNGPWTLDWQGAPENSQPEDMTTLYEAMQQIFGTAYVSLFDKEIKDEQAEQEFILATKDADYIVLTVGEEPYSEFKGNINDLTISVKHQKYIQLALLSGKPVILVLLEGRPRLITKWEKYMSAIVFAGYPGYFGGLSLADLISGKVNPSGRLTFSYPRFCQHNTPYYVKKSDAYNPLYPFGHGISYTQFKVTDLKISDTLITDKEVKPEVVAQVRNVGKRAGKFAALWYVNDKYGTITRPKKMLKHYEKILIKPGEMHTFRWKIDIEKDFSYPQKDGTWIIEPGTFEICLENKTVTVNYLTEDE